MSPVAFSSLSSSFLIQSKHGACTYTTNTVANANVQRHGLEERNSLPEHLPSSHRRHFWNGISLTHSLSLSSFLPPLFSFPLLSSTLSFYLCVRFREIKTTCQVSDAPNLSWQKYALSHAAEHPDTTAEVDCSPGFHCDRSAGLRMPDARPDVPPKKTAIITGYLCVYSRALTFIRLTLMSYLRPSCTWIN